MHFNLFQSVKMLWDSTLPWSKRFPPRMCSALASWEEEHTTADIFFACTSTMAAAVGHGVDIAIGK